MLKLEGIKMDAQILGIRGDKIVRVVQVESVGDNALTIYYRDDQVASTNNCRSVLKIRKTNNQY